MKSQLNATLGPVPAEPEVWRRPMCRICRLTKARSKCNRGGLPICNGCSSRMNKLLGKTPKEIHRYGEQAWAHLRTVVHTLGGEAAAHALPTFDEALPHLFAMKKET